MKISWQARCFEWFLKTIRAEHHVFQLINKPKRPHQFFLKQLFKHYDYSESSIDGHKLITINPKASSQKHLIYFHGGGYVLSIQYLQWLMIKKLLNKKNLTASVLNYPLAPESNYKNTHAISLKCYKQLADKYPNDQFIFLGDSAGGGLSLALLQSLLKEEYKKLPQAMVLVSPWLNLIRTQSDLEQVKHCDQLVSARFTAQCANTYTHQGDSKNPLASPLFGIEGMKEKWSLLEEQNFKALTLYSSDELIRADSQQLELETQELGQTFSFSAYPGMQHVWVLFPLPEAKKALEEIKGFIEQL